MVRDIHRLHDLARRLPAFEDTYHVEPPGTAVLDRVVRITAGVICLGHEIVGTSPRGGHVALRSAQVLAEAACVLVPDEMPLDEALYGLLQLQLRSLLAAPHPGIEAEQLLTSAFLATCRLALPPPQPYTYHATRLAHDLCGLVAKTAPGVVERLLAINGANVATAATVKAC